MFGDVSYMYRNFLHLCLSKIHISVWWIIVWLMFTVPIFIIAILVAFIDPIDWTKLIGFMVQWWDVSLEIVSSLATHPFWLIVMILLLVSMVGAFLLASNYTLYLLSKLTFNGIKRKNLDLRVNLKIILFFFLLIFIPIGTFVLAYMFIKDKQKATKYFFSKNKIHFSFSHIKTFLAIVTWNMVYLLAPSIILVWAVFFMNQLLQSEAVSPATFENLSIALGLIFALIFIYVSFRILFGFIVFASEWPKKKISSWRSYLQESIKITKWLVFFKYVFMLWVFILLLLPFQIPVQKIDSKIEDLRYAYIYKFEEVDNIDEKEFLYYEYLTKEYEDLSADDLLGAIRMLSMTSILIGILEYFIVWGLFVILMTSFYKRVLTS